MTQMPGRHDDRSMGNTWTRSTLSRRRFLGTATGAIGGLALAARPFAALASVGRPTVAVFGGGIAGLTTAHELAERGFQVSVYEGRAWGGKARSMGVPSTAAGGRLDLPGEHGFRITFGFYENLPETMKRIPFGSNRQGVYGNLTAAPQMRMSRAGGRDVFFPTDLADARAYGPARMHETLVGLALEEDLPPEAAAHLADRMMVFLSSCDARRIGQWEHVSWSDFARSDEFGGYYRRHFSELVSHVMQASHADRTSTKFVGKIIEAGVYNLAKVSSTEPTFRVLDAPTNEAWIEPWIAHLTDLGVDLNLDCTLQGFAMRDGRISAARVSRPTGVQVVRADNYVCALPVERAVPLLSEQMIRADPALGEMRKLQTAWMSGIQFYLRHRTPLSHGHVVFTDSPWAISGISQSQFWPAEFANTYGDGTAHECISVIASDWNTPGRLTGKPARDCTPDEVVSEVWEEMKCHVNDQGTDELTDDLLLSWHLDPGMIPRASGGFDFEDPLVLPTVGAWPHRPESGTAIPNLILAGDYVRGDWEMANMEIANESGRHAANVVLERSGSKETPAPVFGTYRPPEFEALKRIDEQRWRNGEPNLVDELGVSRALDTTGGLLTTPSP
jgi:uncharacterized protein with NAD-binding domain and iron-sulfur cluster